MLRELCTAGLRSSVPDEPSFPGDWMPFDAEPEWTETAEKRGLDPLGLQGSGITLYQDLLPGNQQVALHIRYYGSLANIELRGR